MSHFNMEHDNLSKYKNRYIITVKITIYRQKLGCYPPFLSHYNTPDAIRDGYTTKFWYLCVNKDGQAIENLTKSEAEDLLTAYSTKYDNIIEQCEESGNWSNCPIDFSKLQMIYSK